MTQRSLLRARCCCADRAVPDGGICTLRWVAPRPLGMLLGPAPGLLCSSAKAWGGFASCPCAGWGSLVVWRPLCRVALGLFCRDRVVWRAAWCWGGLSSLSLSPPSRPPAFINNKALAGSHCRDHHQVPGTCLNRACRLCPPSPGICTHQPPPRSNRA